MGTFVIVARENAQVNIKIGPRNSRMGLTGGGFGLTPGVLPLNSALWITILLRPLWTMTKVPIPLI
jgi:hypothetical protein